MEMAHASKVDGRAVTPLEDSNAAHYADKRVFHPPWKEIYPGTDDYDRWLRYYDEQVRRIRERGR